MHIILTGATGSVGAPVLKHCLSAKTITKVSILSRGTFTLPSGDNLDNSKANVIIHKDYSAYPEDLLAQLEGAEGCVWAQGISQTQVNKDEYIRITHDFPMAAAKAFSSLPPSGSKFKFVYISGEGADPNEKTFTLFGKIKGRTEKELLSLPSSSPEYSNLRVYNVRPGFVDPPRPGLHTGAMKWVTEGLLAPAFRTLTPSMVSPVAELSKVSVDLAFGDGEPLKEGEGIGAEGRTIRSSAIRKMGKN